MWAVVARGPCKALVSPADGLKRLPITRLGFFCSCISSWEPTWEPQRVSGFLNPQWKTGSLLGPLLFGQSQSTLCIRAQSWAFSYLR